MLGLVIPGALYEELSTAQSRGPSVLGDASACVFICTQSGPS